MKNKILIVSNILLLLIVIITIVFTNSKISKLNEKISVLEESQKSFSEEMKSYEKNSLENKKVIITKEDKASVKVNENFEKDGLKLNVRKVEVNKEIGKGYRVILALDVENLEDEREVNVGNLIKITDKNDGKVEKTISFDGDIRSLNKNQDIRINREYISDTKEINIKVSGVIINQ